MKLIALTRGLFAAVDDEDYERVNQFKWNATRGGSYGKHFYAGRTVKRGSKRVLQSMHGFILEEKRIDHKDCNGLNNQKCNLRAANRAENGRNRRTQKHSSQYKGVSFVPRQNQWQASGCLNKKKIHIGTYQTPELASLAYDTFAQAFYGQFARTNQQMEALSNSI